MVVFWYLWRDLTNASLEGWFDMWSSRPSRGPFGRQECFHSVWFLYVRNKLSHCTVDTAQDGVRVSCISLKEAGLLLLISLFYHLGIFFGGRTDCSILFLSILDEHFRKLRRTEERAAGPWTFLVRDSSSRSPSQPLRDPAVLHLEGWPRISQLVGGLDHLWGDLLLGLWTE